MGSVEVARYGRDYNMLLSVYIRQTCTLPGEELFFLEAIFYAEVISLFTYSSVKFICPVLTKYYGTSTIVLSYNIIVTNFLVPLDRRYLPR